MGLNEKFFEEKKDEYREIIRSIMENACCRSFAIFESEEPQNARFHRFCPWCGKKVN